MYVKWVSGIFFEEESEVIVGVDNSLFFAVGVDFHEGFGTGFGLIDINRDQIDHLGVVFSDEVAWC